ncbi:MAG: hypothetical protein ACRDQD_09605 [Nocardioidaceae bacterium]
MTPPPVLVRVGAFGAPVLLFLYGLLRRIDGLDGDHGPGVAWNVGHSLFLLGFVLFGVLIVGVRRLVAAETTRTRIVADAATVAGLVGVGCFLWVILGDLFADLDAAAPLPEPLELIGPLAFQLGLLVLVLLMVLSSGLLKWWSPVLVLAGFVMFAADLDLLSFGALLLLGGLGPLALPVVRPDTRERVNAGDLHN